MMCVASLGHHEHPMMMLYISALETLSKCITCGDAENALGSALKEARPTANVQYDTIYIYLAG